MNDVLIVLVGVIGVLLLAVLLELRNIRTSLAKLVLGRSNPEGKTKEGSQTVTVNVGALVNPEKVPVVPVVEEATVETEEEQELEPPVKPAPKIENTYSRPTPGGLGIVKCPHCGSENTSFRSECFKCGKSLR